MKTHYTPTIEEFHPGFEFECKERFLDGTVKTLEDFNNSKWVKQTCNSAIMYIERSLNGTNSENGLYGVRVKYLDREDIESLGFELDQESSKEIIYTLGNMIEGDYNLIFNKKTKKIDLFNLMGTKNEINVQGLIIKNKSELKKILNMASIL